MDCLPEFWEHARGIRRTSQCFFARLEGRRITEFLGLAWDEQQAKFYEGSRRKQLYSPTYQNVTLPVYSRSINRWRAYEEYLAPILPALEPYRGAFGYA